MAIVESVVEILLQKLADPLIQEAILLHGVDDQVQWLEAEFRRMLSFLQDADAKQEGDERVKNWVGEVRDVAYDAEDVIDTFLFKVATLRRTGFVGCIKRYSCIFNELIALHQVGSKIERLKTKIRAISESRSTYGIENLGQGAGTSSAGRTHQEWRLTSPLSQESDFVGFEKDMEILVAQLMEGKSRRCVVSVVGMGGLGKTTLTKKVYNNTRVKMHFTSCAWISVSQEYSVKDLLQNIINCYMVLSEEDLKKVQKMNVFELRHEISECLKDKRYLMVLDDIWDMEAWNALKDAFPDVNNGSRVVLTTRIKGVALYADPRSQPHELRFLTNEESWDLFCKKTLILVRDGGCPQDLEKLGREIVEKCHGLPLAIAVIGGLLSGKERREWENVRKSISWQFIKGEVKISHILSLSYKDLPYYLKPCFLYLGNFPEDHEFLTKELIQMWAAEGFLQPRGEEETLEEVGEDCLRELIQRSMVQVARRSSSRNIKSCRIHDLLRDLSISEAKEGMFLQVHSGINASTLASRARRVAIYHNNSSEYISLSCSTPHVRSVLMYTQGDVMLQTEQEKFLFRGFKLLRVLYMHGARIKELPREIGELVYLRYLGCTKTEIESLPSSIGNLPNLQTLFVASACSKMKVPITIGNMKQLRHFQVKSTLKDVTDCIVEIEGCPGLDRINSLQTLSFVRYGKWMEDGCLGKLTNLRKLGIWVDTETDAKVFKQVTRLDCLHSLNLHGNLHKLPDSSFFPTNLTNLTFRYFGLKEDPMVTLEKLKNLRILRLLFESYLGKEMACSAQGFPRLESLHLQYLHHLEEWRVEEGAMPSLLHLQIYRCYRLKKLPEGLQHVSTLDKFELWGMSDEFKARLEEDRGEDWCKIRHIPSIDISNRRIE